MAESDILMTGAKCWYGPVGETLPDETSVAWDASWGGNWTALADLSKPLTLVFNQARHGAERQNALGVIKDWIIGESHLLRTEVDELTGPLMALLLNGSNSDTSGGASQKAYSLIKGGGDAVVDQYAVGFEGYRVDTDGNRQPTRIFYYKASLALEGGFSMSRTERVMLPITIRTYPDPTKTIGQQLFEWHHITGPTTS